jgi:ribosomal protein S18 acetylase RimI-like enzyme
MLEGGVAMSVSVRQADSADIPALTRMDLTYPTDRYIEIEREGEPPEETFRLKWRTRQATRAVYASYSEEQLRAAVQSADCFLTAEVDGRPTGLLIVVVPKWSNAAEITDLAIDNPSRRIGAGSALLEGAAAWAWEKGYRALWVEPRADNYEAMLFYLALGFRISGFNDRLYSNEDDQSGRQTIYMYLEL